MRQHPLRWLTWGLVAVGIALRTSHLLANRSLWLDEAMLALNILDRDFAGLLQPLDMAQNAPVGYLWAVEGSTVLFGEGEIALRLPPREGDQQEQRADARQEGRQARVPGKPRD